MYIARQPIFDRMQRLYGYELLYRYEEHATTFSNASATSSTATILGGLFELGVDNLVGSAKAFVNFNDSLLHSDSIRLISPETLVIEILENTPITDELMERVKLLKKAGYKIALDDFCESIYDYPLVPLADIIKFDILITPLSSIHKEVAYAKAERKLLLAEKIETQEEFELAKSMGFHLFQGFFFSRPAVVGGLNRRKNNLLVFQRILKELHAPEPSFQRLTELIESDSNTAYRLLQVTKKESVDQKTIKNALTKMGLVELERWVNIIMLQNLSQNKPAEILRLSIVRSKFGELLAANSSLSDRRFEVSLMGLFSLLDGIMDTTLEEALGDVNISDETRAALLDHTGIFNPAYEIMLCYERGDCPSVCSQADRLAIDHDLIPKLYVSSLKWADEKMKEFNL